MAFSDITRDKLESFYGFVKVWHYLQISSVAQYIDISF